MKQPDLGLKVSELRKEKGFTQEQLAEFCQITPRTMPPPSSALKAARWNPGLSPATA